ncbi:MAG: hypothetical protein AB7V45_11990 [Candidatus Krumholzibacteriia bacterium]
MRMMDGTRTPPVDRPAGALLGMFIADALAMPVHLYEDRAALRRDHGLEDLEEFLHTPGSHRDTCG